MGAWGGAWPGCPSPFTYSLQVGWGGVGWVGVGAVGAGRHPQESCPRAPPPTTPGLLALHPLPPFAPLQARFLVDHPQELPVWGILALLALKALGYAAFRGANSQKDLFRRDPQHPTVRNLRTLPTARGTRLIVSGWWGVARHVNYLGDWLMA